MQRTTRQTEQLTGSMREKSLQLVNCSIVLFFFFQAEDGIRDYKVTGVQTCALPILKTLIEIGLQTPSDDFDQTIDLPQVHSFNILRTIFMDAKLGTDVLPYVSDEIGRASCRERV